MMILLKVLQELTRKIALAAQRRRAKRVFADAVARFLEPRDMYQVLPCILPSEIPEGEGAIWVEAITLEAVPRVSCLRFSVPSRLA